MSTDTILKPTEIRAFPLDPWTGKPKRTITAYFQHPSVPQRRVVVSASHWKESRAFSMSAVDQWVADGTSTCMPMESVQAARVRIDRYSKKALQEFFDHNIERFELSTIVRHFFDAPTADPNY